MKFYKVADKVTEWSGRPSTAIGSVVATLLDILWGYFTHFSQVWLNGNGAATGFVAIILLFFLQHSTNRGDRALHIKLDTIISTMKEAPNAVIGIESKESSEITKVAEKIATKVEDIKCNP